MDDSVGFDPKEFNDLIRRASDLLLDTMDIPRLLRTRLGAEHQVVGSADEMLRSLETFVHELRLYHGPVELHRMNPNEDT
ncbi:MAG: hypothetical protein ABSB86_04650 [Bryobacteraceae bacterium]|jgi:hypothetical protein